ncbi:MAG: hypothetical protein U9N84_09155 [Actinomycetota bacterium]|nr:hypothetical protein [Actinomycetota bacterium]
MDLVFLIIGWLSIPLVLVAVFMMISTLKSEQLLRGGQLLVLAAISTGLLFAYEWVLDAERSPWSLWLLIGGAVAGGRVATTVDLRSSGLDVYGTHTYWYMGLWAATYSFAQLTALGALPAGISTGLASMYFATGVAVGLNLVLWNRQSVLKGRASKAGTAARACAACGTPNDSTATLCSGCHLHLVPTQALIASPPVGEEISLG